MRKWDEKTFLLQLKPLGKEATEKKPTTCLGEIYALNLCLKEITNVNSLISLKLKSQFLSDQTGLAT